MRYTVYVPVTTVDGRRLFAVDAESEDEAVAEVRSRGVFISEEVEVVGLDFDNAEVVEAEEGE